MPLDARVRRFLAALSAGARSDSSSASPAERRAALAALMAFSGPADPVERIEQRVVPGPAGPIAVRLYVPVGLGADSVPGPGLVYFHGGGLVAGSLDTHEPISRALATAGQCRVVSVDYRLGPEHPFPAAIDDAQSALAAVAGSAVEFGIDPARLGVAGDSAGAALAAVVCQLGQPQAWQPLRLQLLICPILDYAGSTDSRREFGTGYLVDEATLAHDLLHYLPSGVDPTNPRVSPLRADDLSRTPPTSIHTAEFDPLRDDGRAYYESLVQSGTDVSYTCHAGMIHLFYGMGGVIPYAREAFGLIGRDIRAALA